MRLPARPAQLIQLHPRALAAGATLIVAIAVAIVLGSPQQSASDMKSSAKSASPGSGTVTLKSAQGAPMTESVVPMSPGADQAARDGDGRTDGGSAFESTAAPQTADVIGGTSSSGSQLVAPEIDTRIIRTGTLDVRVKKGMFNDTWIRARTIASGGGAYVATSSVAGTGARGATSGTMEIRVPSARFEQTVAALAELGKVRSEAVSSQDVTAEYVDAKSRLRHDRAVEARLLALLAKTTTVAETLAVQARLDTVQEQLEVEQGRINYLEHQSELSTITLALSEKPKGAAAPAEDGVWATTTDALVEARDRFLDSVNGAIIWLGGALPALLLLAGIGLVGRSVIRRHGAGAPAPAKTAAASVAEADTTDV